MPMHIVSVALMEPRRAEIVPIRQIVNTIDSLIGSVWDLDSNLKI